jgi:hypothetical protein
MKEQRFHVDASPHNAGTLRNITNIMASKEDLIYKSMQVEVSRERQYCKKVEQSFLDEINRKKAKNARRGQPHLVRRRGQELSAL